MGLKIELTDSNECQPIKAKYPQAGQRCFVERKLVI